MYGRLAKSLTALGLAIGVWSCESKLTTKADPKKSSTEKVASGQAPETVEGPESEFQTPFQPITASSTSSTVEAPAQTFPDAVKVQLKDLGPTELAPHNNALGGVGVKVVGPDANVIDPAALNNAYDVTILIPSSNISDPALIEILAIAASGEQEVIPNSRLTISNADNPAVTKIKFATRMTRMRSL